MGRKYILSIGVVLFGLMALCAGRALAQNVEVDLAGAGYDVTAPEEKILGFSKEQLQNKETLSHDFFISQEALREQARIKREAFRQELSRPEPDRTRLQAMAHDILVNQGKLVDNRMEYIFKVREILTAEQWQRLRAIRAEFQAKLDAQEEERENRLRKEKTKGGNIPGFLSPMGPQPVQEEPKK